jgi:hypothetical protein
LPIQTLPGGLVVRIRSPQLPTHSKITQPGDSGRKGPKLALQKMHLR